MTSAFPLWLFLTGASGAAAFSPDGEAWLESLRDRMASGLGGQEAYQEAWELLASDPEAGCGDWIEDGMLEVAGEPAWTETLRTVCPEAAPGYPGRRRAAGSPALDVSASQSARPAGEGSEPALWSVRGRAAGAALGVAGRGRALRKRSARLAVGPLAAQWGHWDGALGATRIGSVAGNRFYARERGSAGTGGPLASAYPGLDGLALGVSWGPWRAQTAGAWNRLSDGKGPGNPSVTVRRDAGLVAAGLARSPAAGPDLRAQAFLARLEAGPSAADWLAVAGVQWAGRGNAWTGRAAAASSASLASSASDAAKASQAADGGPMSEPRCGAFLETDLAYRAPAAAPASARDPGPNPDPAREAGWGLRFRQALGAWANPLQYPRGSLRDTLGGWAAEAAGAGGARAETGFPLFRGGGYAAGLRTAAAASWGGAELTSGRGDAAWIQAYGPFAFTLGGGFGWRRPGSAEPASDAARAVLQWLRGPWRAEAAWARRGGGYAGSRPMPLDLSIARRPAAGKGGAAWALAWSAADMRRPGRGQRLDLSQSWPVGNGMRVEQRLRVPWTAEGIGGGLAYRFGLEAEF